MEIFKNYAYYYNAFYQDKDYKAETLQIDTLLKKYGQSIFSIINFGCGTGRHDIELSKMGYQSIGIDISPDMVNIARENAKNAKMDINFYVADIRDFKEKQKYDAVLSLFHVMSYQNKNKDILSAFQTAREALCKGGLFLFDVWYGPGVLTDRPAVRVKEIEDEKSRLVRIAKPIMHDKENRVEVCYEIFIIDKISGKVEVINEIHNMRYFFRPELEILLKGAGFKLIDNLDCKSLKETDYNTWTSYFVAKAI